jgi:Rhodopirellula transposase DDE domain
VRRRFCRQRNPVISVDAKKRELVGNFKNAGRKWDRTPTPVNDHDFRSQAEGVAILYGIFDPQANRGCLFVGVSHETSAFAVSDHQETSFSGLRPSRPSVQPVGVV